MLLHCTQAPDQALLRRQNVPGWVLYELYRSACVKEFEIIIELAGNLLKKALRPYYALHRQAEALVYKNIFRAAAQHGPDLAALPAGVPSRFREALTNSNLPIFVDSHDWALVPESFHPRIFARYEVVRSGVTLTAEPA